MTNTQEEYRLTVRKDPAGAAYYAFSATQGCIVSDPMRSKKDALRLVNELNVGASIAKFRAKGFEAIKAFFREHRVSRLQRKRYDYHLNMRGDLEIRHKDGEAWRVVEDEGEFRFFAVAGEPR
jgi:hypothetical protein